MSVEEKAKEKAEELRQERLPEAAASVSYSVVTPSGYSVIFTMRGTSETTLFERMEGVETFMKDAGYTPEVKKSFSKPAPQVVEGEKCPKCGNPVIKITAKGRPAIKCSTSRYDFVTKTASGCDYFKYADVAEEPATEKQMSILKQKNLWEEGMTKAKAGEILSTVLT